MIDVLRTSSASEARATRTLSAGKPSTASACRSSAISTSTKRIKGVETEVKIPFGDEWKLTVNYTYNDGRDHRAMAATNRCRRCRSIPPTLDWKPLDDWSFYVTANYRPAARGGATGKTPGGTLFDVGAAWRVTKTCAPGCRTWVIKI